MKLGNTRPTTMPAHRNCTAENRQEITLLKLDLPAHPLRRSYLQHGRSHTERLAGYLHHNWLMYGAKRVERYYIAR